MEYGRMGRNSGRFRPKGVDLRLVAENALREAGAASVGVMRAGDIPGSVASDFTTWLKRGYNAGMEWLVRHETLRRHTDSVMPGAKTIICAAFPYGSSGRPADAPQIASYACRADYHNVLRARLRTVADNLKETFGGKWRVCIDSAPVAERYWAIRSGVGARGRNSCVIVPGAGSYVFLAELLTDVETETTTDTPDVDWCVGCGLCIKSCPTGALRCDGSIDTRRCLSYLTIEKRGEFSAEERELVRKGNALFGCDICQRVCPHNRMSRCEAIDCFTPIPEVVSLTAEEAAVISDEDFALRFASTPLSRCGAEGLRRNARALLDCGQNDKKA